MSPPDVPPAKSRFALSLSLIIHFPPIPASLNRVSVLFSPPSLLLYPVLLTVPTLSRELPMTHVVDEASVIPVVMLRKRSLNLHSYAGESPLGCGCRGAGCADCRYGNGGVHGDEGDGFDSWDILG